MKGAVLSLLCAIIIAQGRELPTKQSDKTCNCNPNEAQSICAERYSDNILIAHEYCNKFYKCANGLPVGFLCNPPLRYDPVREVCDWPQNVDCGDRPIYETATVTPEGDNNNGDNGNGENKPCNCNPAEAPTICAREGSDGTLIAHENCNQYYVCSHGVPVSMRCGSNLLYNPYDQSCDWASNVECGERVIPEDDGNDIGGGDNGGGNGNETGPETCNCNPEEAPSICAAAGSDSVLIAHENCNQYYQCNHGVPIPMKCTGNLLYNPYTEKCDWPNNVDCGNRIVPCDCDEENSEDCSSETNSNETGGSENDGNNNGEGDNGSSDNEGESQSNENEDSGNGGEDNGGGTCNCNPGEAPGICAVDGSDGILVAHENCNKFYKCAHGVPVALECYGDLLYNPYTEQCDWPENVDCGDRIIPDTDDSGNDNGGSDNGGGDNGGGDNGGGDNGGGTCNCNPGEAPSICAVDGSDGVLVAHENCNKFYKCAHGVPVALKCYGNLLYNPYTEQCDWPENVDCGDRIIPDTDDSGNDNGGSDNGGGDNGGGDNGGGDNGGGTCNCNPGEAPSICAVDGSDGVLVAHENCNKFYKCAHGVPVALKCYGNLLYNPYTEQCDWPENVDCGDRIIPDTDDSGNDNGGGDNGGGDNGGGDNGGGDNGGGDNGDSIGGGNCDPTEAPAICAAEDSDGILVAHEKCNKYYICNHGVPVARLCPGSLLFNPQTDKCDWPENVDCGDRVIPDPEDGDNGSGDNGGGDNGGGDNGGGDNGGGDNGGGTCNCNPGEAPGICAADGSDGILVAHENCNKFYKCAHGVPVALKCYGNLLYNPYTEQCDWPENVDCGDRIIPDTDDSGNDNGGGDNGGGDNGGGDNGGGDNGSGDNGDSIGGGNCDPTEAPAICAAENSDGILVAHEKCNKYYICNHGVPVARPCPGSLLFNPQTDKCDWPENVDCGDRLIPDPENEDNGNGDNGGGDNGGGDNGGGDNGGGDNGGGTCNCNPGEAPGICAVDGSDGILVAHENCNEFYKCAHGVPVALKCYGNLLYNPYTEQCDWPENVDCGDRIIPDTDDSGNDNGGGDNGGGDNGGGTCNCNPGEAPGICAADGSDGVLVAHEICNKFYKCAHGVPVALKCYGNLLYNPYTEQCDWPENVDCGDRIIPDTDDSGNDNGGGDNGGGDNGGGDNGGGDNGSGDNGDSIGSGNCDPTEAPAICAAEDSDGILVAHEKCNKYYICNHGVPVARPCPGSLLFNPQTDKCDWPENVDCGDRVIPDPEDEDNGNGDNGGGDNGGGDNGGGDNGGGDSGGGDNGGGDNGGGDNGGGTCNCNPGEAPGICAADGSDGVLIAHENCNKFYKCAHGVPVALKCYGNLLYNPYTEQCDWPKNVDCGDRIIPDTDDSGNDNGGDDNGGSENDGGDNGGGDNGGGDNGGGTCNCNPGEAPGICAADGSDGVLIAHENCNKFYKCAHGVPVALKCYGNLLYNPYTEQCDWPKNVDCGDRIIPDTDDSGNDNGGDDNGGSENDGGDNGGGDNGGGDNGGGTCNCNPGEAPGICAADGSDGVLIAHENCNQFYKCSFGVPVALKCYGNLLYNPYTEQCDWPENVDCGDRIIPDTDDSGNDNGGSDNGGGDNGGGDNGGGDNGGGTCNCNPGEAPSICAVGGSDGVLVAHENCNEFYKCSFGLPVALKCYGNLLYNPYTKQCDWPENVDCGDRIVPDTDDSGNDNGGSDNGGGDNGGGDNGGGDNGGGTCNCNPGEAPSICAVDGSDGVLVAHENCNEFYKCSFGLPVALKCYGNLLYNPYTKQCDWPENVDCGDRIVPDTDDSGNDNGGSDNGGGDNGGGDNGGGDNGGGTCNCNPGEAPSICAVDGSDGVLVAHENCNEFYKCSFGLPVARKCYGNLLYNPYTKQCDWPENVDCGDRIVSDTEKNDNDNVSNDNNEDGANEDNDKGDINDEEDCDENNGIDSGNTCNCNPSEAQGMCAVAKSDGTLIAHENCNQFYLCDNGQPVALKCPSSLLYNPYIELCDWPQNVDCGERIISDAEDDNVSEGNGNTNGGGHSNPSDAPAICAAEGSNDILVAHENCNQFYICANGIPVTSNCNKDLLYNPANGQCDWSYKVDCGNRVIPEPEQDNGNSDETGGNGDNGNTDNGNSGGNEGHYDPSLAPELCAAQNSDNVLVAHENCNKFYICDNGKPITMKCPINLLYNPGTGECDWHNNVDCNNRIVPEGSDNGNNPCNCDPRQATSICSRQGSNGMLIAHENCNQYYMCKSGSIIEGTCPANLHYNPIDETCDWQSNVSCGDRSYSTSHISLNKHLQARNGLRV
ncbi:hypothetical protein K1T71_009189 [Dendrolimus kikuchii]|uniref:Uncharacterized protein n=1 Tax=Dendrolimus kikuchii TaxID=765133 RepID=A0ACC1CU11_9NEOP|nr:hypothetical protein K1T71_009189 [Dendrolimus kikuchii]